MMILTFSQIAKMEKIVFHSFVHDAHFLNQIAFIVYSHFYNVKWSRWKKAEIHNMAC